MEENNKPEYGKITVDTDSSLYLSGSKLTSFILPLEISWFPKEDITTYELAQSIKYLTRQVHIMPYEISAEKPEVLRHFKIIDHNKK